MHFARFEGTLRIGAVSCQSGAMVCSSGAGKTAASKIDCNGLDELGQFLVYKWDNVVITHNYIVQFHALVL